MAGPRAAARAGHETVSHGDPTVGGGFTDYLISLEALEGSPTRESLELVWQSLRAALVHELQRRRLWNSPPRYLGVEGSSRWWQAAGGRAAPRDALDELVSDCYVYVFVQRLRSLKAHLRVKDNVDGLVFLAIRNFVHDRQKENDPEGYRIFDVVRLAVRNLLARGRLFVARASRAPSRGDRDRTGRVRDHTVLTFDPEGEPPTAAGEALRTLVPAWNDDLVPEIITGRYRERRAVQEKLERHIVRLPEAGIRAFRFKDLLDPLKDDARARWRALASGSRGEAVLDRHGTWLAVSRAEPGQRLEDRDSFEKLAAGIAGAIDRRPELDARTRDYLRRLWRGLARHAYGLGLEAPGGRGSVSQGGAPPGRSALEDRPSNRELARSLGIPRDRLPDLLRTLGRLVREYQAAPASRLLVENDLPSPTAERRS